VGVGHAHVDAHRRRSRQADRLAERRCQERAASARRAVNGADARDGISTEASAMKKGSWLAVAVLAVLVAGASWYWWQGRTPTAVATRSEAPAPKVADATPPSPPPAASEPRIRHPIEAAEPEKTPTP